MTAINFSAAQINRLRAAWWLLENVLPHRAAHTSTVTLHVMYNATACKRDNVRGCIWSDFGPRVMVMKEDPLRLRLAVVSQFFSHEGQHVGIATDGSLYRINHDCEPHFCADDRELKALEAYAQEHVDLIHSQFNENIAGGIPVIERVLEVAAPVAAGAGLGLLLGFALKALFGASEEGQGA